MFRRALLPALLSAALLLPPTPARPAPIPFGGATVAITARDQPVAAFMSDLFGRFGRPVVVSAALTGQVNGRFEGDAGDVFDRVARAFNVASYYDGATVYLFSTNEVAARSFPGSRSAARRAASAVGELGLTDQRNVVRVTSTGILMASGAPRFLEQVGEIARMQASLPDAPVLPRSARGAVTPAPTRRADMLEFRVFYLRYARAEDTVFTSGGQEVRVPGVANVLRSLVLDQADPAQGQVQVRPVRQSVNRLGGRGLAATAPSVGQVTAEPQLGFYDRFDQFANEQRQVEADSFLTAPQGAPVRIQAAPNLNALIVRDAPERMAAYSSLIQALDVEPQVVEIEATIIDVNTQRLRELGIDFRAFTTGVNFRSNTLDTSSGTGAPNIGAIFGGAEQFVSNIRALQRRDAVRIVARPQVLTISNVEATFDRTETFFARVQGFQAVDLFNVTVGTVLRVNPHVFRDRNQTRIRIGLGIEDGRLTDARVDSLPVVERAALTTQALLLEGESLLVGGLTIDTEQRNRGRVPILGDIPVIGNLFRNSRTQAARTERLFLITPRVTSVGQRVPNPVAAAMPSPEPMGLHLQPPPAPPFPTTPGPGGTPIPPPVTGVAKR